MTKPKRGRRPRICAGPTDSRMLEMPSEMWQQIDRIAKSASLTAQEVIRRLLGGADIVTEGLPPSQDDLAKNIVAAMQKSGVRVYLRKSKKEKTDEQ